MGLRVVSSALAVPDRIQTAAELSLLISKSAEWIESKAGVPRRRIGTATLDSHVLAAQAARAALNDGLPPDLVLYACGVQRQAIPDTSVFVCSALGIEGIPSFSVSASCLSFLVALKTADALLLDGTYSRILICAADLATLARNMAEPESAALLGDGAAAVVVERGEATQGILNFKMKTWPMGAGLAEIRGGGTRAKLDGTLQEGDANLFWMDGRGLMKLFRPRLKQLIQECLQEAKLAIDDVDLIIPHQTSKAGFQLLERIGIPSGKTVNIIKEYGNCVAAALPMALATAMADGRLESGKLVMFVGTSAGASAAVMLMRC
jgi:3-oxoacyl-[acyl-carrier-protein] synthase-3